MVQTDFLNLVVDTVETNCKITGIRTDTLVDGGIFATIGSGRNQAVYYDRSAIRLWPVKFMAKDTDHEKCISQLDAICTYLQKLKKYPKHNGFVWLDATVEKYPARKEKQDSKAHVYMCKINMQVYY